MDHSYSIDTVLYSQYSGSQQSQNGAEEAEGQAALGSADRAQIERELGVLPSREASAEHAEGQRKSLLKRCLEGLSNIRLSDKISLLNNLWTSQEYDYSLRSSVDSFVPETAKSKRSSISDPNAGAPAHGGAAPKEELSDVGALSEETADPEGAPSVASASSGADLDDATLERVFLVFLENSDKLARKAMSDNQHVFADKLVCNVFRKLAEVYGGDPGAAFENSLDAQGLYPLFNLGLNVPARTPASVRARLESMAADGLYRNNLAERIFIFGLLAKFRMTHLVQLCSAFRQRVVVELWPLALDAVLSSNHHDPDNLYQFRNSVFNANRKEDNVDYRDMPSIEPGATAEQTPPVPLATHSVTGEYWMESECGETNTARPTGRLDSARTNFADTGRRPGRSRCYIGNAEALDYIINTNPLDPFNRVDLLKSHFNLIKGSDVWVNEPHNRLQTYYLVEKDQVSIKVRGKVPCNIITALTIITETELGPEWVSCLKKSTNLHSYSRTSRIFQQSYEYPMVGRKETLVYGLSTNVLDEANCVIISCLSPPSTKKDYEAAVSKLRAGGFPDPGEFVRFDDKGACTISGFTMPKIPKRLNQRSGDICFLLFPYTDAQTIMEVYANVVPEVKIVPMKVVTFIIKKIMVGMFRKIANISSNFQESKFAKFVAERSEFYSWMDDLYRDYKLNNPQTFKYDQVLSIYTYHPSIETKPF